MTEQHPFADGVVSGPAPQPGDRIRVTRTEVHTTVYEGFFEPTDDDNRAESGWSALVTVSPEPGRWMRLRDRGPRTYSGGSGGVYVQSDVIEVIEVRDGTPYRDIVEQTRDEKKARDEAREKQWAAERRDRDCADRRAKLARWLGRHTRTEETS